MTSQITRNARPPFRGSFPTAQFHVFSCIVVQGCNRPRAVVLLSSEPRAASEKVKLCKLMAKKEERLGRGEEKDDRGGFIAF